MSITLAFILLTSLILWFVIGSKGLWRLKAATILLTLYLCLSVNFSLDNLMGWPSRQQPPKEFRVHWVVIKEPNKKTGDKGDVYVWVTDMNPKEKDDGSFFISFANENMRKPRSYRLEYSKELHEDGQKALEMIMGGQAVMGTNEGLQGQGEGGDGQGDGQGAGQGEGGDGDGEGGGENGGGAGGGSLSRNGGISFQPLPPSKLPSKGE